MPDILYLFKPPQNWIDFKTTQAKGKKLPPAKRDANGNIMYEQWPDDPTNPKMLLDFKHLPDQIGSQEYFWVYEAWRRYDPRIRWKDILMRQMLTKKGERSQNSEGNNINMMTGRGRKRYHILTWDTESRRRKPVDWVNKMTDQQIRENTTRGLTPGLTDPTLGEVAGNRVPIPITIEGAGMQKPMPDRRMLWGVEKDRTIAQSGRNSLEEDSTDEESTRPPSEAVLSPSERERQKTAPGPNDTPTQGQYTVSSDPSNPHTLTTEGGQPVSVYTDPTATDLVLAAYERRTRERRARERQARNSARRTQRLAGPLNLGHLPGTSQSIGEAPVDPYRNFIQEASDILDANTFTEANQPDAVAGTSENSMRPPLRPQSQSRSVIICGTRNGGTQRTYADDLPPKYLEHAASFDNGPNAGAQQTQISPQSNLSAQAQQGNVPIGPHNYSHSAQDTSRGQPPPVPSQQRTYADALRGGTIHAPNRARHPIPLNQRQPSHVPTGDQIPAHGVQHPGQHQFPTGSSPPTYATGPQMQYTQQTQTATGQPRAPGSAPVANMGQVPPFYWAGTRQDNLYQQQHYPHHGQEPPYGQQGQSAQRFQQTQQAQHVQPTQAPQQFRQPHLPQHHNQQQHQHHQYHQGHRHPQQHHQPLQPGYPQQHQHSQQSRIPEQALQPNIQPILTAHQPPTYHPPAQHATSPHQQQRLQQLYEEERARTIQRNDQYDPRYER